MEIVLSLIAVGVIVTAFIIAYIDIGRVLDVSGYIEPAMKNIVYRHIVTGAEFHRDSVDDCKDIVEVNENGRIYRYLIEYRTPPSTWKRRRYTVTLVEDPSGN